ncbi:DUF1995 domain-containing protein [Haematococcus lacustris]|uniref:DUF1995 domain-containing protein n=1 Tax=Haematococcus lacustris TaxID=44745 RepID=A0A699ZEE8_HAELA|nr:DUF1995 domain-containing protein [Haematococcus lacustris]
MVEEAVQAVLSQLAPITSRPSKVVSKGFGVKPIPPALLHVEIPIASQDPQPLTDLAFSLGAKLAAALRLSRPADTLLVFSDTGAVAHASRRLEGGSATLPQARVMELRQACRQEAVQAPLLLMMAPTLEEVALAEQLVEETWSGGQVAVLVNAGFKAAGASVVSLPQPQADFVGRLLEVYCFQPVSIKGFLGSKEGAVVRRVERGGAEAAVWRILLMRPGGRMEQVGQTRQRPSNTDLELAFINASAAASPLTNLVKAFRGKGK